ncbi:histidine kinase [Brevibacterium sp. 50QC2O2]|uniref:sensor histidine kinase n=1 Tax=unclassified Brevibacterium TaxID=2614124 RepID=UPI00211BE91B|nr:MULTISPECIES: histidine kinase [unclassified Brevibacterium]MCQ9367596.1 histidine kinase [Brevibacterium sp. 91QC2O2]MCQ9389044.1 histidine kinase [Brevibacterium sp. 50QC2O2]
MENARIWAALTRSPWRFLSSRWPWLSLLYLAFSALLGLLLIPVVVLGFLILPLSGLLVGAIERRRNRLLGFAPQASPHAAVSEEERPHWLSIRLTEAATWRETAALFVDLALGITALVVLFFEGVALVALGMIAYAGITGPTRTQFFGEAEGTMTPGNWWPVIPLALLLLFVLGYLNTILAATQASLNNVLCGPWQRDIDRRVARLTRSRAALVESFEVERRRIERDLHDGVQQDLIALGARLGMISYEIEELASTDTRLRPLLASVDAAQGQAEQAMATLRNTVRGIHPSVLTDHGLSTALQELAERAPLTVNLHGDEGGTRYPAVFETNAYYFVSEALNNTVKHADATNVEIRHQVNHGVLTVTVIDNGRGGAHENNGLGIAGLRDRAETLNGSLTLTSPKGGPTQIQITLPLTLEGAADHAHPHR